MEFNRLHGTSAPIPPDQGVVRRLEFGGPGPTVRIVLALFALGLLGAAVYSVVLPRRFLLRCTPQPESHVRCTSTTSVLGWKRDGPTASFELPPPRRAGPAKIEPNFDPLLSAHGDWRTFDIWHRRVFFQPITEKGWPDGEAVALTDPYPNDLGRFKVSLHEPSYWRRDLEAALRAGESARVVFESSSVISPVLLLFPAMAFLMLLLATSRSWAIASHSEFRVEHHWLLGFHKVVRRLPIRTIKAVGICRYACRENCLHTAAGLLLEDGEVDLIDATGRKSVEEAAKNIAHVLRAVDKHR